MVKVAVLGANGFIGSRTVELFHLLELAEVRPVVRSVVGMARLARFDLDCRIADGRDEDALAAALLGCDVAVYAIAGDPATILGTLQPCYRAAQRAGVRRLVYLSSASVHGQNPQPGSDEGAPLDDQQPIAYNNAKVHAERRLLELREQGSVELVLLRPGIVYGPRSFWVSSFASDLLAGRAYLVGDGAGICNGVYVDNLVHAIYLALTASGADREALLIGDRETYTWADLYRPIAAALGFDLLQAAHQVTPYRAVAPTWRQRVRAALAAPPARAALARVPRRARRAAKAALVALLRPAPPLASASPWDAPAEATPPPEASLEMTSLHQCRYKLPFAKASALLGYEPLVSFAEGCERTVGWLAFAGYPVVAQHSLAYEPEAHDIASKHL